MVHDLTVALAGMHFTNEKVHSKMKSNCFPHFCLNESMTDGRKTEETDLKLAILLFPLEKVLSNCILS